MSDCGGPMFCPRCYAEVMSANAVARKRLRESEAKVGRLQETLQGYIILSAERVEQISKLQDSANKRMYETRRMRRKLEFIEGLRPTHGVMRGCGCAFCLIAAKFDSIDAAPDSDF